MQGNPPEHTLVIPFTRMLAGPLDYTPGIFELNDYQPDNRVSTTLAKQLANMVILYSPLQMASDLPENYIGEPALEFIERVPVNWDESQVLKGEIGEYITMARRQGESWYLGKAQTYPDLSNHWSQVCVERLSERGIIVLEKAG